MNILELPVIGNRDNDKDKIFTLLSDQPLRNFEGLDFGCLKLEEDLMIYLYFLNQENDNYRYLWDIVIPHTLGCILVCDWKNSQLIEENLRTIEYIEQKFNTPLHVCSLPASGEVPESLIEEELKQNGERQIYSFDPTKKESAKNILLEVIRFKKWRLFQTHCYNISLVSG